MTDGRLGSPSDSSGTIDERDEPLEPCPLGGRRVTPGVAHEIDRPEGSNRPWAASVEVSPDGRQRRRRDGRQVLTGLRLLNSWPSAASPCVFAYFGQGLLQVNPPAGQLPAAGIAALARLHDQIIAVDRDANGYELNVAGLTRARLL